MKADQYNRAMFTDTQVAFIGGGNMTEALVRGLLRQRLFAPGQLAVSDPLPGRREWLATQYGVMTGADNRAAVQGAGTIVLSVEPQVLDSVLE
ncbi:pyrroline-5-carboxylate reductase, partial [Nitrospirales bacterium NOB]|nr:pyrroline-5-carboxylate reductase [Nitrospirales bacterium NOB]